jgi:hypothetical protein
MSSGKMPACKASSNASRLLSISRPLVSCVHGTFSRSTIPEYSTVQYSTAHPHTLPQDAARCRGRSRGRQLACRWVTQCGMAASGPHRPRSSRARLSPPRIAPPAGSPQTPTSLPQSRRIPAARLNLHEQNITEEKRGRLSWHQHIRILRAAAPARWLV